MKVTDVSESSSSESYRQRHLADEEDFIHSPITTKAGKVKSKIPKITTTNHFELLTRETTEAGSSSQTMSPQVSKNKKLHIL